MNTYLAWTGTILYCICWPIGSLLYYLSITIVAILKLIYWPIAFLLQPVVYLLRFIVAILALPFRALVKLEVSDFSSLSMQSIHVSDRFRVITAFVQLYRSRRARRPARRPSAVLYL
jgi:hypothetical protein